MVIQIAEVLETTVNVLLGEELAQHEEQDLTKTLAAKLEVLNEQYSKQNESRRKIWRIIFAVILIISIAFLLRYLIFSALYTICKIQAIPPLPPLLLCLTAGMLQPISFFCIIFRY